MDEIEKLEEGIKALETQRATLGDEIVDSMLAPIREKIASLKLHKTSPIKRKQITVLFADISGYTSFAESIDAEELLEKINALWKQLDEIITKFGGIIDKHIGDEVMALWGADIAREDDAELAICAALEMQSSILSFQRDQPFELRLRIGIHTGLVMLGTVGSKGEFTAMGDTVNLASRLQHAAPIGHILISHHVYRQVRGVFDLKPLEPIYVKGKSQQILTYVVITRKPRAFRVRTRGVEGVETRMIGRESELEQLKSAYHEVVKDHLGRLIMISGEAGVGKSRLLYEFQNWLDLSPEIILIFKGRATDGMQNVPYALIRDILSYRFEIADSDSAAIATNKLENGIASFMPGDEDAKMKAHFIGHLIGFNYSKSEYLAGILDDPKQIRDRAFHYIAQLFQSAAKAIRSPVTVFFIDDLHWADDGSLDVLDHIRQTNLAQSLLIVGLTRPIFFDKYPNWKNDTRLYISPLSEKDSHELVSEILQYIPNIPHELVKILVDGAEGNPFYIEELVKMLIDQKVIITSGQTWKYESERLSAISIPDTLTGVLQARLDNLPVAELEVLQRAAVIGRVFWGSALAALAGKTNDYVPMRELQYLMNREFIYKREVSAFLETNEYIFKHAILREVTYETVLNRMKKSYHAQAANWLIRMSQERANEYAGVIAEHFELSDDLNHALMWYGNAGEIALSRSAFAISVKYFSRALSLIPPSDRLYSTISRQKGDAHFRLGDLRMAMQSLEVARKTAQVIEDQADALAILAEVASESGNYENANALLSEALPLARNTSNQVTLSRALFALGSVQWRLGNLAEAKEAFSECLGLARVKGDVSRELHALNRLGAVALGNGQVDEAERLWMEVYSRAVAVGNRERAMAALNNLGSIASSRKNYSAAREYIQGALEMARELGTLQTAALALINLGEININLGYLEDARKKLREGLALAVQLGTKPRTLGAVIFFAELAFVQADTRRAINLWGLAKHQPAWTNELQRAMDQASVRWRLEPDQVNTWLEEGAKLNWDLTIQELLEESTD